VDNARVYAGQVVRYAGKDGEESFAGKHPPLIPEELARRVGEVRAHRADPHLTSARLKGVLTYPLTPLLHCGVCGARFRGQLLHGTRRYWHGVGSHGWARLDADRLEAEVIARLRLAWPSDDVESIARLATAGDAAAPDTADQVARLRRQLEREKDLYALGDRSRAEYLARKGEIEREIAGLTPREARRAERASIAAIRTLADALDREPCEEVRKIQKALLGTVVARIETDGKGITAVVLRPYFAGLFGEVIQVYPQPELGGHHDQCAAPSYRARLAARNAELRRLRAEGWTFRALGERYGISTARAEAVAKGRG
jgi:hypothetical protein